MGSMWRNAALIVTCASGSAFGQASEPVKALPLPRSGEVAPDFEHVEWLQLDAGASSPEIAKLRGEVVVLATFGHFCDSCVRTGIPLANAIRVSNPGEVLTIEHLSTSYESFAAGALLAIRRVGTLEGGGANSLRKPGGTAIVVHATADDYRTDPSGNSGPRIACGVIPAAD